MFTEARNIFPMPILPLLDNTISPSLVNGSYIIPFTPTVEGSYGTSPRATQLQTRHIISGTEDPNTMACLTFRSSPSRDEINGTTSLYINN
mmetsp:Transcript_20275/g.34857  ORF Transcript_20275/g.34857 Transcript_20275/m.34857 type:complete len:91 (+) Transcript_20275:561-833(+)